MSLERQGKQEWHTSSPLRPLTPPDPPGWLHPSGFWEALRSPLSTVYLWASLPHVGWEHLRCEC